MDEHLRSITLEEAKGAVDDIAMQPADETYPLGKLASEYEGLVSIVFFMTEEAKTRGFAEEYINAMEQGAEIILKALIRLSKNRQDFDNHYIEPF